MDAAKVPAWQRVHAAAADAEYRPAAQLLQAAAPLAEYAPALHGDAAKPGRPVAPQL